MNGIEKSLPSPPFSLLNLPDNVCGGINPALHCPENAFHSFLRRLMLVAEDIPVFGDNPAEAGKLTDQISIRVFGHSIYYTPCVFPEAFTQTVFQFACFSFHATYEESLLQFRMHRSGSSSVFFRILSFLLSSVFLTTLALCSPSPLFAAPPERIISLAPNVTEILFAIGLGDRLTGVTQFCDYPEEAMKKPKVGGMSNPSLEAVISLKPDIVVLTTDGNPKEFEERLRSLKIRTFVFRARRLAELPAGIRELGAVLGVPDKASALAKKIEDALTGASLHQQQFSDRKKILFVIWPEPLIVAGRGTVIDDVIALFGHENVAAQAKTSYPKYSMEEVLRQSPDIVFIGKGHTEIREMSEGFLNKIALAPAVKKGKVFFLSDNLYRMGPRILMGIEEMAACLQ